MSLSISRAPVVTTEVVVAPDAVPRRQHQVRLTPDRVAGICADYRSKKISTASLAKRYGVHPQTVARHLREAGIEIGPQPTGIPDGELLLVAQLRTEGWTYGAIAERLGCSRNTARDAVERALQAGHYEPLL